MLEVFVKNIDIEIPEKLLKSITEIIYKKEQIKTKRVTNLIICSDYIIRKLNCKYRQTNKTTDVLSFSFNDNDLLGEIFISSQRTKVQAQRYHVTFFEELIRLYIHGLLHLAGFDHHQEDKRQIMEKKEKFYRNLLYKRRITEDCIK